MLGISTRVMAYTAAMGASTGGLLIPGCATRQAVESGQKRDAPLHRGARRMGTMRDVRKDAIVVSTALQARARGLVSRPGAPRFF